MKKKFNIRNLSLLAVLVFIGLSCSNTSREINENQLQHRGDGLYYAVNEEKPYTGKAVKLYKNGQKGEELTFKNGKLHGLTTSWNSEGQKTTEINFENGVQSGAYRTWFENGQQRQVGALKDENTKHGHWTLWDSEGQKQSEGDYRDGKEHGQWTYYYDNGQKMSEGHFKDGKNENKWVYYYKNGKTQSEGDYRDGKEHGQWTYYYDNGQKMSEGHFKDGIKGNDWTFWTKDGQKRETDTVTDIDGNTYITIKIGNQWWMAENLKVTRYRNGDAIPNVTEKRDWANLKTGAYCSYENEREHSVTYGYLYNWFTINDQRGLAPQGWHVPSDAEWRQLSDYLGENAGGKMKQVGTSHWQSSNEGASNESRFSALPGGYRDNYGNSNNIGNNAYFWSSEEHYRSYAWHRYLSYDDSILDRSSYNKKCGFSVRCVRD